MFNKTRVFLSVGSIFFGITSVIPLSAGKLEDPSLTNLTAAQYGRLRDLPYGLAGQKSLLVRYKHVDSVSFFGAGKKSQSSFKRGDGLMPEALSLRLKNSGEDNWATGVVAFKHPMDVSKYNSVAVWVRAATPGMRFWVGLQNPDWKRSDRPQSRSDIFPARGFPIKDGVLYIVPYSAIQGEKPVDFKTVNKLTFEFGQDTTGNPKKGTLQILGVAFIEQEKRLASAKVIHRKGSFEAAPEKGFVPPPPVQGPDPKPFVRKKPVENRWSSTAASIARMTQAELTKLFKKFGLEINFQRPGTRLNPNDPLLDRRSYSSEWVQDYARYWPHVQADLSPVSSYTPAQRRMMITAWILALAALITGIVLIRRRKPPLPPRLGKLFHEINWPFGLQDSNQKEKTELEFWKQVGSNKVTFAWLSISGLTVENASNREYYGLDFFERQIRLASKAGVRLCPSFNFIKTQFNLTTFLSNPLIYKLRPMNPSEKELSDEVLTQRVKNLIPVQIPSFWQKQNNLEARLFVEAEPNGAQPGQKMVAFNQTTPELKEMVKRTIRAIAGKAPGVRIENAIQFPTAFWVDVITAIKSEYPEFMFIADHSGEEAESLRQIGFDYFENDSLTNLLLAQIQQGNVGTLPKYLEDSRLLRHTLHNVSKFLKPMNGFMTTTYQQNLFAAVLSTLLPGVIQYNENLPDDLANFIKRASRSMVLRKGKFIVLSTSSANVLAIARWRHNSLYIAVANFSSASVDSVVRLSELAGGFENNRLYLFNNPLHGVTLMRNLLNQPDSGTPALALWGQNLKDTGLPLNLSGLSLRLFSVNLTRVVEPVSVHERPKQIQQLH